MLSQVIPQSFDRALIYFQINGTNQKLLCTPCIVKKSNHEAVKCQAARFKDNISSLRPHPCLLPYVKVKVAQSILVVTSKLNYRCHPIHVSKLAQIFKLWFELVGVGGWCGDVSCLSRQFWMRSCSSPD